MKFRKRPVVIEAITFDQLVEHGRANGGNIVNGMPWSFSYNGHPITHETDDCYLIPTLEGTMKFNRGDMLITGIKGELYPCRQDIFEQTYVPHQHDRVADANGNVAQRTPIGIRIIEAIVEGRLFRMECPDAPGSGCLATWAANAHEQIEAAVMEYVRDGELLDDGPRG